MLPQVPFVDMFNHDSVTTTLLSYDTDSACAEVGGLLKHASTIDHAARQPVQIIGYSRTPACANLAGCTMFQHLLVCCGRPPC